MAQEPASGVPRPPTESHATPIWVKVTATVVAVLFVALIIILLATGDHGPGRHAP